MGPFDPGNPVHGTNAGPVATLDGWAKPFADTLATLFASATTVFDGYYARVSAGYRFPVGDNFYAGPELALLGNSQYRQLRFGLHATGLEIGWLSLGLSGGVTDDRDNGTGIYGTLSAWGRL